jgi:hypothetical protein
MEDKNKTYHESQKKAIRKYKETDQGKEKAKEASRKYYLKNKNNIDFVEKMRSKAKQYYYVKKEKIENLIKEEYDQLAIND